MRCAEFELHKYQIHTILHSELPTLHYIIIIRYGSAQDIILNHVIAGKYNQGWGGRIILKDILTIHNVLNLNSAHN